MYAALYHTRTQSQLYCQRTALVTCAYTDTHTQTYKAVALRSAVWHGSARLLGTAAPHGRLSVGMAAWLFIVAGCGS